MKLNGRGSAIETTMAPTQLTFTKNWQFADDLEDLNLRETPYPLKEHAGK